MVYEQQLRFEKQIKWYYYYYQRLQMKKGKENGELKRATNQFFKYIKPGQLSQGNSGSANNKVHTRSMVELQDNYRYQLTNRQLQHARQLHFDSVSNNNDGAEVQQIKSNSLNKFLSLFGGTSNSNSLLNLKQGIPTKQMRLNEADSSHKKITSGKQVFTCNIRNMNMNNNSNASIQKEMKIQQKCMLMLKKQKAQKNPLLHKNIIKQDDSMQTMLKMKKNMEELKERQVRLVGKVLVLQGQNKKLKEENKTYNQERISYELNVVGREKEFIHRIQLLQIANCREKCKQHDLIINSLKKVINQQLRKIIEFQTSKIERDQIQKLEQCINKNMGMNKLDILSSLKLRCIEVGMMKVKRKEGEIKIQDKSISSAGSSHQNSQRMYNCVIDEATEEDQLYQEEEQENDAILEEVDKYLANWRGKS